MFSTFFEPDNDMAKFIINLSDDKTIIDIGCGNGTFLQILKNNGSNNFLGFEPHTPFECMQRAIVHRIVHRYVGEEFTYNFMKTVASTSIVTLCRPCHDFILVKDTYNLCKKLNIPMYYIGLKQNITQDLDHEDIEYELIQHQGTSKDSEVILLIKF